MTAAATGCPETGTWRRVVAGVAAGMERTGALEHASRCPRCRQELAASVRAARPESSDGTPASEVPPKIRRRVEAFGPRPGSESGGPGGAVRRSAGRRTRWIGLAASVLVAVGLGGLAILRPAPVDREPRTVRSAEPLSSVPLPLAPAADAEAPRSVRFRWHAVDGARSYDLVVLDARGERRFLESRIAGERGDTELVVLRERLGAGEDVHWFVEVHLADGRSAASDPRRLVLPPP